MSDYDIHSCGYYCDRHACILRQRDELRDKLFEGQAVKTYSGGKPNYTQPIEPEPVAYRYWNEHNKCYFFCEHQESDGSVYEPMFSTPLQREWVDLTDEEIDEGAKQSWVSQQAFESAVWWAMKALKEKNGG